LFHTLAIMTTYTTNMICFWKYNRVTTTLGNPWNLLEFKSPPGNLEFNWSSWKFLCKISHWFPVIKIIKYGKIFVAKIWNLSPSDVFFQVPDAPKPIFGWGSAPDPCGGAYDAPPDSYLAGEETPRAEITILWIFQFSVSPPKEAEARQTSWIFLKIPPGISWKFAWLNL